MTAERHIYNMQLKLFEVFKSQDPEVGYFDVVFEVEGKKLYANKNLLSGLSDFFKVLLSDQWTKKDAPIKIDAYSFDDFNEFLTFLYSGSCNLNDENVARLVDIAESYGVEQFKKFIDSYLASTRFTTKNIFDFIELSTKYDLPKFQGIVNDFILQRSSTILKSPEFLLQEKAVLVYILVACKHSVDPEELFKRLCDWGDNQAQTKLSYADYGKEDVKNEAVKNELADLIHHIHFNEMSHKFMCSFVARKHFIFSHPDEFAEILSSNFDAITIMVTNEYEKLASASLIDNRGIYDAIQKIKSYEETGHCFVRPLNANNYSHAMDFSEPSESIKSDEMKYYLVCERSNVDQLFKVTNSAKIGENDLLIAELNAENGFAITEIMKIEAFRNY